ncbi:hypothetical protein BpHYR1_003041 [Brachionus plicatilis]|uniref:Uncharacterized protein n=1 Tax=Brachionus plicatilis TaxID=10195 RepID=A0A3M7QZI4_BRAPC|nr:hypothetical protein BpHYR1_003041 [Brachionus plicatilis]
MHYLNFEKARNSLETNRSERKAYIQKIFKNLSHIVLIDKEEIKGLMKNNFLMKFTFSKFGLYYQIITIDFVEKKGDYILKFCCHDSIKTCQNKNVHKNPTNRIELTDEAYSDSVRSLGVSGSFSSLLRKRRQGKHLRTIRLIKSFISIDGGFSA